MAHPPLDADYRHLFQAMDQGVVYQDREGRIVDANPAACRILGLSLDQMMGRESVDPRWRAMREDGSPFPGPEHPSMVSLATGKPAQAVMGVYNPETDTQRWLSVTAQPVRDQASGEVVGAFSTFVDITDLRHAQDTLRSREREVRERNAFIERLVAEIPVGIAVNAMDTGDALFVNPRFAEIYGWPASELTDVDSFFERVYPDPDRRTAMRARILGDICSRESRRMRWIDVVVVGQDGTQRVVDAANIALPEQNLMISTVVDATERARAVAELESLEWMLSRKVELGDAVRDDSSYDGLLQLNRDGRILASIGKERLAELVGDYLELLGSSSAVNEASGDYALGVFSSAWCRRLERASRALCGTDDDAEAMASGRWLCHESCWTQCSKVAVEEGRSVDIACNGGIRLYAEPIVAGGEVVGAINFGYGDPPRSPAELERLGSLYGLEPAELAELAASYDSRPPFVIELAKRRLHTTARLIGAMIESATAQNSLRERLKELRCLHEISRLMAEGQHALGDLVKQATALIPPAFQYPERTVARVRVRDEAVATGDIDACAVRIDAPILVLGAHLGVVEVGLRAAADRPPRQSDFLPEEQALIDNIAERIGAAVLRSETEAYQDALIACSPIALHSLDPLGRVTVWNAAAAQTFGWPEAEILGRRLPTIPEDMRDQSEDLRVRAMGGQTIHGVETTRLTRDGRRIPCRVSIAPLAGPGGVAAGIVVATQDLSEHQRQADEIRNLEQRLFLSEKLESIGRLAGGVAHDFNNMLTVINSFTSMALDGLHEEDPLREDLGHVLAAGERAADLTRQLLAFSRKQVLEPVVLDLNALVSGLDRMLRRLIGESIQIQTRLAPDLASVKADPAQVEQIVMNLVINARDAMPTGGRLTIETANAFLDRAYADQHPGVVPGPYAMLAITDTGAGMPPEVQQRVFEPFFSTKSSSERAGLGLATVFGIVKQSGGSIWLYSEVGHGTTFKVYLPATEARPARSPRRVGRGALRGSETVLVVEDEAAVLMLVARVLRSAGYRVITARNAGEALLHCERRGQQIALLLTDVVMPGMSGRELAERLAEMVPQARVLYMSGYTENAIGHHGVLEPDTHFISKPLEPRGLLRKVRQVLDGPEGEGAGQGESDDDGPDGFEPES